MLPELKTDRNNWSWVTQRTMMVAPLLRPQEIMLAKNVHTYIMLIETRKKKIN